MEEATNKPVLVLSEWPLAEGFAKDLVCRSLTREGVSASQTAFVSLLTERPYDGKVTKAPEGALADGRGRFAAVLRDTRPNVILALGEFALREAAGREGIDKWQSSVIEGIEGTKVVPCFSAHRIQQDLSLQLWLSLSCRKVAAEASQRELVRRQRDFLLNPPLEEALAFLRDEVPRATEVSVDIETGRGQINTVGFAISPARAIAVNVLPDRLGVESFYAVWDAIRGICESDQPKILQNFIYETLYFSRYGVRLRGVTHDTMICQKFLWPEFEMGLDAVGRMYSEMSYWKDDGKSWNNIRDWEAHYEYNCKDTTGTYEGYLGQRKDLEERGLASLHDSYLRKLYPGVVEMCSRGLPVSRDRLRDMRQEIERDLGDVLSSLRSIPGADSLNPRSPAQLKSFLAGAGRKYNIPKKRDSKTGLFKPSTDAESLKKLQRKHPEDPALPLLLRFSKLNKAKTSYLDAGFDPDGRMRYSINCHGTETGRWSANCDPWGNGVNPQTIPGGNKGINIKSIFEAPPGFTFLQCDLKQAETRFVAYDAADINLITALEDPSRDVHSEVAEEICRGLGKNPAVERQDAKNWKYRWRQLGKRSGHGSNYAMAENTFINSCLSEMDLVLTRTEANTILESYHKLFQGVRRLQSNIRREVAQTRCLRTPLGRVRQFWGRLDDNTFREAYAYRPQSTIPDIVNHLMLHLLDCRRLGQLRFNLLLQVHDSLLFEVPEDRVTDLVKACHDLDAWHPIIDLAGGRLRIPVGTEVGKNLGELCETEDS